MEDTTKAYEGIVKLPGQEELMHGGRRLAHSPYSSRANPLHSRSPSVEETPSRCRTVRNLELPKCIKSMGSLGSQIPHP